MAVGRQRTGAAVARRAIAGAPGHLILTCVTQGGHPRFNTAAAHGISGAPSVTVTGTGVNDGTDTVNVGSMLRFSFQNQAFVSNSSGGFWF